MREITKCKLCNKDFELTQTIKKCVNLGCTKYNVRIRRRINVRKKNEKNQEEE